MSIGYREYTKEDLPAITEIWNSVVADGLYYPQTECLDEEEAKAFFGSQSFTGVAEDAEKILGVYILHPNNIGRCGHIANASYAVKKECRGRHTGEGLVRHSMKMGAALGFRILQFNAVVASNKGAIHLYEKIGFTQLGVIPGGFRLPDNTYADILPFYISLAERKEQL